MLIALIFRGQALSKSICLFLSQTFLWGKALKGHIEAFSHKSIAVTIVGSLRAPLASVCSSLALHISHSQRWHTSMSQSLFLSSAQRQEPKMNCCSPPHQKHYHCQSQTCNMKKPMDLMHASLSEQHCRKTPGWAVSAHLGEIRETPFTRQSHTKGLYTVQHNSSMRYPLGRQFIKWEDNITFIILYI